MPDPDLLIILHSAVLLRPPGIGCTELIVAVNMSTLMKDFTMLGEAHHGTVFEDYEAQRSAKFAEPLTSMIAMLRHHHPEMTISTNLWANLLGYATAGYATAELDTSEDSCIRIRGYSVPQSKDDPGQLLESFTFARYKYSWKGLNFILYRVVMGYYYYQFLLFPPDSDETVQSNSKATDALLLAIGAAMYPYSNEYIYLFNGVSWYASPQLYQEVQKTSWKDVILDEDMKLTLTDVIGEFFDNEVCLSVNLARRLNTIVCYSRTPRLTTIGQIPRSRCSLEAGLDLLRATRQRKNPVTPCPDALPVRETKTTHSTIRQVNCERVCYY